MSLLAFSARCDAYKSTQLYQLLNSSAYSINAQRHKNNSSVQTELSL